MNNAEIIALALKVIQARNDLEKYCFDTDCDVCVLFTSNLCSLAFFNPEYFPIQIIKESQ